MKKTFIETLTRFFVLIALTLSWSCQKDGNGAISITGDCTDIGESSATLHGTCNLDGVEGASVIYGIEWSSTDLTTESDSMQAETKDSKNKYTCRVTGLAANTLYYYRSFALNNGVRSYGKVKTFKTLDFTANVTTLEATEVTEIRATLRGVVNVSSKDDLSLRCWFLLSDTATDLDAIKNDGREYRGLLSEDGHFRLEYEAGDRGQDWLKPNTQYYYVAAASVHGREIYGEMKSFTTLSVSGEVITMDATDITDYSAVFHGKRLHVDCREPFTERVGVFYSNTETTIEGLTTNGRKHSSNLLEDGSFSVSISGFPANETIYYVAVCQITIQSISSDGAFYSGAGSYLLFGDVKSFSLLEVPELVDLGLSVKWRNWNLGGSSPEDYGDYFAWGETETKSDFNWSTYKWCDGSSSSLTKYNTDSALGVVDNLTTLEPMDDAAHVILGGNWRIPTAAEWNELMTKCTSTWVNNYHDSESDGRLFTAANGNSIFIPAAGARSLYNSYGHYVDAYKNHYAYYWSSSLDTTSHEPGYSGFNMYSDYKVKRSCGLSVRPVCDN